MLWKKNLYFATFKLNLSLKLFGKKKNKEKKDVNDQSFWDHLEALRWHVIRSAVAIVALALGAFYYNDFIFTNIILSPKEPTFITNELLCWLGNKADVDYLCINSYSLKIINTQMAGQLTISIWVSIVAGLIVAIPYILWEFWRFVRPALNEKERRYSRGFVFTASILFLFGVLFSYFLIVPLTVNFLGTYKVSSNVENFINLDSYISTVTTLSFATGLIFEFPILVYFLTKTGIITPGFLSKQRKYIFIIILIVGAIITPPDIISQVMVSIPLYGLYELSIYVSRVVYKNKKKKLQEEN